ncbi:MAG: hypothetical protein ABJH45_08065 [Paracoccaceae bacterium]
MSENSEEIIAEVSPSWGRRVLGLVSLWGLGLLVFYLSLSESHAFGWQVLLLAIGGGTIYMAELMRRATGLRIELTATEVRDSSGRILAEVSNVESVDRGTFAFKPSNGFLITCKTKAPRVWAPGLWWRNGRRIGIGGITAAPQTKFMAEVLSAMIAERDGQV